VNVPEDRKIKLQPGEKVLAILPSPGESYMFDAVIVVISTPAEKGSLHQRFSTRHVAIFPDEPSHHAAMLFPVFHAAHKAMREAIDPFIDDWRDKV